MLPSTELQTPCGGEGQLRRLGPRIGEKNQFNLKEENVSVGAHMAGDTINHSNLLSPSPSFVER